MDSRGIYTPIGLFSGNWTGAVNFGNESLSSASQPGGCQDQLGNDPSEKAMLENNIFNLARPHQVPLTQEDDILRMNDVMIEDFIDTVNPNPSIDEEDEEEEDVDLEESNEDYVLENIMDKQRASKRKKEISALGHLRYFINTYYKHKMPKVGGVRLDSDPRDFTNSGKEGEGMNYDWWDNMIGCFLGYLGSCAKGGRKKMARVSAMKPPLGTQVGSKLSSVASSGMSRISPFSRNRTGEPADSTSENASRKDVEKMEKK